MNRLRVISFAIFLVVLTFSCEQKMCGCMPPPELPIKGDWTLAKITYGLSQKTVTAAEAGYSETVSFTNFSDTRGNYRRVRNGIPVEITYFSASFPNGGTSEGLISFPTDSSQQSFRLTENNLYLSERGRPGAVLADGSTYEYQR